MMRPARRILRSTWTIPTILAATTLAGLVFALTGDGWRDLPSWIGLLLPVLAAGAALRPVRTPKRGSS